MIRRRGLEEWDRNTWNRIELSAWLYIYPSIYHALPVPRWKVIGAAPNSLNIKGTSLAGACGCIRKESHERTN